MIKVNDTGSVLWIIGTVLYALFIALILPYNVALGATLVFLPLMVLVLTFAPRAILLLLLLLIPFHATPILSQNILDITGFKPFNLLSFIALFILLLGGDLLKPTDSLEKKTLIFIFFYFVIFSVVFFRSLDNLSLFRMLNPSQFGGSEMNYILTFFIKPTLYMVSFLLVLKWVRTSEKIEQALSAITIGMFFMSCTVVYVGITHLAELTGGRSILRDLMHTYLGMHYNTIGSMYIICSPLLLYKAITKQPFWLANFILAAIALLFLQSRSAILVFVCSTALLLILSKKRTLLIAFGSLVGLAMVTWVPVFISQGLMTGFAEGTWDARFTGRITTLWMPLLAEWGNDPMKLFFGAGRFGLMTSPLWARGFLLQAGQAHNAYIDFFLDSGIILFGIFLFFLYKFMKSAWRYGQQIASPLYWALFVSIVSFLAGAMTERQIFPSSDNIFLFPVIALLINLIRIYHQEEEPEIRPTLALSAP